MAFSLTKTEIRRGCGSASFQRGLSYFNNGQVLSLEVERDSSELVELQSRVRGSGGRVYSQRIRLQRRFGGLIIRGDCSCPMEYNCKHVAASCIHYQTREQTTRSG